MDSVLSYGVEDATVCCFDKRGTYLAVGYATGVVVIWDFVTRQGDDNVQAEGMRLPCCCQAACAWDSAIRVYILFFVILVARRHVARLEVCRCIG